MEAKNSLTELNTVLIEAGFPSTMRELENPTQEYMMKMLINILHAIDLDTDFIQQPTADQCQTMSTEDLNAIRVLNIYVFMQDMCPRLFINDFDLTDITCPTPKKAKKILRLLMNFILYKRNKMEGIQDEIDSIQSTKEALESIMKRKNDIQDRIIKLTQKDTQQSALMKQNEIDVALLESQLKTKSKELSELKKSDSEMGKEKQYMSKQVGNLKTTIAKLNKEIEEDRCEVISSPERPKSRLKELEEENAQAEKLRQEINQTMQDENKIIQRSEKLQTRLESSLKKSKDLETFIERCKRSEKQSQNLETNNHKKTLNEIAHKTETYKKQLTELRKANDNDENQDALTALRKLQSQLSKTSKRLKTEIEEFKSRDKKLKFDQEKSERTTKNHEREIENFIKSCQKIYDDEIAQEKKLQSSWYKKL